MQVMLVDRLLSTDGRLSKIVPPGFENDDDDEEDEEDEEGAEEDGDSDGDNPDSDNVIEIELSK